MFRMGLDDSSAREKLSEDVGNYKVLLRQGSDLIQRTYLQSIPTLSTLADLKEERKWLNENCRKKVDAWEKDCDKLGHAVMNGALYQPVSTQELEDIVRSFGFCTFDLPLFLTGLMSLVQLTEGTFIIVKMGIHLSSLRFVTFYC